ncbi:conserved hypothetical protein [uncultured spirochete]|uniref:FIST C-domain domain-containing protein n=1 Tax=uncultured spirochete TaxID=156406 RepID=A0A3P3XQN8_9SPIR|nr:conserved hypothetical protein [uncultured spirochete]
MLQANVGSSIAADAREAGKEAATAATVKGAPLAFVYSSCDYDQSKLLEGAAEILPDAALVGCTSYTGVLTPSGFMTGPKGYVAVMAFRDDDVTLGIAGEAKKGDARETGRRLARAAMTAAKKDVPPAYFYMVAAPGEEESYLKGVEDVIGRVPFFGGSAADNSVEGKWKLLFGKDAECKAFSEGLILVFFYTKKAVGTCYTGEYAETRTAGIITKVEGKRRLVEIDGEPALKKYASWRGLDPEKLKGLNLLGETICHPLGVKDRLGDLVAIRHPMVGNEDYSMNIGSDIAQGTAVVLMEGNAESLIASTGAALRKVDERLGSKPGAYLLVHCGGRRGGIGGRMDEAYREIKRAAGDVPFIGVFTFGEYGYEDWGANTCGGLMLSFAGFEK